jgi:hypothetical protein
MGAQPAVTGMAELAAPSVVATEFSYDSPEHLWSPRGSKPSTRIRLLKIIQPFSPDIAFNGTLIWAELDHNPSFTALSYAWGTGLLTSYILISGQRLPITATLEVALRRIVSD